MSAPKSMDEIIAVAEVPSRFAALILLDRAAGFFAKGGSSVSKQAAQLNGLACFIQSDMDVGARILQAPTQSLGTNVPPR